MSDERLEDRRIAAELFGAGVSRADAARRLGVSRATATRWYRVWEVGGAAALAQPGKRGRPPKLEPADLDDVQRALARPPAESGFPIERWSLAAVVALIRRATGIAYHPRHVVRVLRRAGWVVPPVGELAEHAFREREQRDPDGNAILLRERPRA